MATTFITGMSATGKSSTIAQLIVHGPLPTNTTVTINEGSRHGFASTSRAETRLTRSV